ncbi:outer membrane beta-barrel protein [Sphingomonas sp. BN140010]|uniref:Outer membrane beta-barrel protein n=1 Tax=Sphingomonas arvum TaxID=2992113 RepID=A0ABT3JBD1_9SPHN|nr:OmpW family outer membrane protein [Sphingomonas sp. BN140010]MCW3796378.1 outer membrane beta-barrel protein [Sphingomonas sp. BN140010]
MMNKYLLLSVAALAAQPAHAEAGDVILRARAIVVAPQEKSSGITPAFPNEEVKVSNYWAPEVDATYMVTNNIGLELIAATTKHKVSGKSGTTGSIGKLASSWVLPPTLTAQYHFAPSAKVRPYVGVGVNYTIFYNEDASGGLEAAVGKTRVRLKNSFGPSVQAGADFDLGRNLFLNVDAKWIDMDTTARLSTTAAGVQRVRVHLDPLVLGVGIGTRF